jgi:hypothetical protein
LVASGRSAVGADKFLGTGFRLFVPEMSSPGTLMAKVAPALRGKIDGFYDYGLVPAARLGWIPAALQRH